MEQIKILYIDDKPDTDFYSIYLNTYPNQYLVYHQYKEFLFVPFKLLLQL